MLAGQVGRYWPIEGPTNGIPLNGAWDDAKQAISSQEARDRQRQCLLRNIIVTREALIIDLLLAAGLVKSDNLDVERIMEIRHGGSLKAIWPFTPIPRQTMSIGASARRAA